MTTRLSPTDLYKIQVKPSDPDIVRLKQEEAAKKYGTRKEINGFDVDGVITLGIRPGPDDVIITGRSYVMAHETLKMLSEMGIHNPVYFNPEHRTESTREQSGRWKALVLHKLKAVTKFFEDDPIQWEIIQRECPNVNVVYIMSDLVEK